MSNSSRTDTDDPRMHRVSWAKVITSSMSAGAVVVALNVTFAAVAAAFTTGPTLSRPMHHPTHQPAHSVIGIAPSLPPPPALPLLFILPPTVHPASIVLVPSADGIPSIALTAYVRAARADSKDPACHLPWQLIAAIGYLESDHGQIGGDSLDAQGREAVPVEGIALDGNGVALISDGKGGYARAEGPMQFIPRTWARWGADGNRDGHKDVQNIFDATLAAAQYLCSSGSNLSALVNQPAAIRHYNDSPIYVKNVMNVEAAYAAGLSASTVTLIPMPSTQTCPSVRRKAPKPSAAPSPTTAASTAPVKCPPPRHPKHHSQPTAQPTRVIAAATSAPPPTPSVEPSPSPSSSPTATTSPSAPPLPSATPTP